MDSLFKKVNLLVNNRSKKAFICKCLVPGEEETSNYCNIKQDSFKALVRHLKKEHKILLPDAIICNEHEVIMTTTCAAVDHYKFHTLEAFSTFNYQDASEECSTCQQNIQCIKMVRPGMSCIL